MYLIESEMGVPRVMQRTIEVPGVGNVAGAMVNVGNPHFVLFVDTEDFSAHGLTWQELGAKISTSPLFPHGTNVEFVRVLSPSRDRLPHLRARLRPYDLVGHWHLCFLCCGDGACAASERELTAIAEGGPQRTVWPANDAVMRLTGPAEIICRGEVAGPVSDAPMIKPRALRPGATLAVLSPASTPKPELVAARRRAPALSWDTRPSLARTRSTAGHSTTPARSRSVCAICTHAFADPAIDGIICTRGGWGSAELLPYLDATLIRANPKPFIGYSDHTSLHCWLRNEANLITFHGPMAAADFSRDDGARHCELEHSLLGDSAVVAWHCRRPARPSRRGCARACSMAVASAIFAEALGTPYAPRIEASSILFLEDIGTKPYQWDRMLLHLRYSGLLEKVTGHRLRRHAASASARRGTTISSARFCTRCATLTGPSPSACAAATSAPPTSRFRSASPQRWTSAKQGIRGCTFSKQLLPFSLVVRPQLFTCKLQSTSISSASAARRWPRWPACCSCRGIASPAPIPQPIRR